VRQNEAGAIAGHVCAQPGLTVTSPSRASRRDLDRADVSRGCRPDAEFSDSQTWCFANSGFRAVRSESCPSSPPRSVIGANATDSFDARSGLPSQRGDCEARCLFEPGHVSRRRPVLARWHARGPPDLELARARTAHRGRHRLSGVRNAQTVAHSTSPSTGAAASGRSSPYSRSPARSRWDVRATASIRVAETEAGPPQRSRQDRRARLPNASGRALPRAGLCSWETDRQRLRASSTCARCAFELDHQHNRFERAQGCG
jgi:hypothetical protein